MKCRYQDVSADDLVFSWKRLKLDPERLRLDQTEGLNLNQSEIPSQAEDQAEAVEVMDVVEEKESSSLKDKRRLEKEKEKITEAVKMLKIDPTNKVDHKDLLSNSARKLNSARLSNQDKGSGTEVEVLKAMLCQAKDEDDWTCDLCTATILYL